MKTLSQHYCTAFSVADQYVPVCRYETLTALLESNELGTVSEFNVFLAAMRWVEADESREPLLDEVLGLIRFPTMDYEELGLVGKHHIAAGAGILKVQPLTVHKRNHSSIINAHQIFHLGLKGSEACWRAPCCDSHWHFLRHNHS